MANLIVALILLLIFTLSISKVIIEKRKGVRCVGCSQGGRCSARKTLRNKNLAHRIEIKQVM